MADAQIVNNVGGPTWLDKHKKYAGFIVVAFGIIVVAIASSRGGNKKKPVPEPVVVNAAGSLPTRDDVKELKKELDTELRRAEQENIAAQRFAKSQQDMAAAGATGDTRAQALQQANGSAATQPSGPGPSAASQVSDGGFLVVSADGKNSGLAPVNQQQELQGLLDKQKEALRKSIADEEKLSAQITNPPSRQQQEPHEPQGIKTTNPTGSAAPPQGDAVNTEGWNVPQGPRYVVLETRAIPCMLMNRIDGEYAGPIKCITTTDFYANDTEHLVIPVGSFLAGEASAVDRQQQKRIAVRFHRVEIHRRDHSWYTINLDHFVGLDQTGAAALSGKVNTHLLSALLWSVPIGGISGLSMSSANLGYSMNGIDAYRMGVSQSAGQTANQVLGRKGNVLPTITIPEGQRIEVWVAADLSLPEYRETGY